MLAGQTIRYFAPADSEKGTRRHDRQVGELHIVGVRVDDGGRTLTLATDPHPRLCYVLPLGALEPNRAAKLARDSVPRMTLPESNGSGTRRRTSPRRASVARMVACARAGNDHSPDAGLGPARREPGTPRQPGRLAISVLVHLPEGMAKVQIESTGSLEEATLGESQGEPVAEKGPDGLHRVELAVDFEVPGRASVPRGPRSNGSSGPTVRAEGHVPPGKG